jgi:prepilin-type N-terminal cleavage/methylation domain-containing protein
MIANLIRLFKPHTKQDGFTIVEIITVLSILAILSVLAIPRFADYTDTAKVQVCRSNCETIERVYEAYLITLEELEHSELFFSMYMIKNNYDICPDGGVISYVDGEIHCSIHNEYFTLKASPSCSFEHH